MSLNHSQSHAEDDQRISSGKWRKNGRAGTRNAEQVQTRGSWKTRPGMMPEDGYSTLLGDQDLPCNKSL
ncbi:hypothetical protein LEMLEM_LOCUS15870, partial [Lemmus lemmus]